MPVMSERKKKELPGVGVEEFSRRFERDLRSGKFAGAEGHWAAYVNGKFIKTDPDEDKLYAEIREEFGKTNIEIFIQPICEILTFNAPLPNDPPEMRI